MSPSADLTPARAVTGGDRCRTERTAALADTSAMNGSFIRFAEARGASMPEVKTFLKEHKLLTAGLVVSAVLIGFGIGRAGQTDPAPKAIAEKNEDPLARVEPAPALKFDETYAPGQSEQIGLRCNLKHRVVSDSGVDTVHSNAIVNISIDSTKNIWWVTDTEVNPPQTNPEAWPFMWGTSYELSSLTSSMIYLFGDAYGGASSSWVGPSINRISGRYYTSLKPASGGLAVWDGNCVPGIFRPQPGRVF